MTEVSIERNSQIHLAVNLGLFFVTAAAAGYGLKMLITSWLLWTGIYFVVFWLLAFLAHRVYPKITGLLIDRMFPAKREAFNSNSNDIENSK
jgi:uncharacterized membrane protein (Fun14 family)